MIKSGVIGAPPYNPISFVPKTMFERDFEHNNRRVCKIRVMGKSYYLEGSKTEESQYFSKRAASLNGENLRLKHNDTKSKATGLVFYYDAELKGVYVYPKDKYFKSKPANKMSDVDRKHLLNIEEVEIESMTPLLGET